MTKTPPVQTGSELAASPLRLLTANSREAPAFNKKTPLQILQWRLESGRLDLNQRPPAPEAGALPGYATPRR